MNESPVVHPDPEQLAAYGLGYLSPQERATIEAHVAGCPICCERLQSVPSDSLVALVQSSAGPATRIHSGDTLSDTAAATASPEPLPEVVVPADLPAGLAHHPRYRTLRVLGQGGMGAVYLAEHRLMGRLVALKVIRKGLMGNAHAIERFRREVKAAARLAHPNIVTAHDAEEAGDTHFLVMEYVEGASLAEILDERGPMPVPVACHYARQAALGLQHAAAGAAWSTAI